MMMLLLLARGKKNNNNKKEDRILLDWVRKREVDMNLRRPRISKDDPLMALRFTFKRGGMIAKWRCQLPVIFLWRGGGKDWSWCGSGLSLPLVWKFHSPTGMKGEDDWKRNPNWLLLYRRRRKQITVHITSSIVCIRTTTLIARKTRWIYLSGPSPEGQNVPQKKFDWVSSAENQSSARLGSEIRMLPVDRFVIHTTGSALLQEARSNPRAIVSPLTTYSV